MIDPPPSIDHLIDLPAWRRRLLDLRDRTAGITARAESPDRLVTATVGGFGTLLELTISPRIYRAPDSRRLAAEITGVVQEATRRARARISAELVDILAEGRA